MRFYLHYFEKNRSRHHLPFSYSFIILSRSVLNTSQCLYKETISSLGRVQFCTVLCGHPSAAAGDFSKAPEAFADNKEVVCQNRVACPCH